MGHSDVLELPDCHGLVTAGLDAYWWNSLGTFEWDYGAVSYFTVGVHT